MDQIIPAPAPTRTEMGDLSSLTTTQKGSIVGAINEVDAEVSALNGQITNIKIRESNSISKSITSSDEGGTIATSYQNSAPQGYTLIARSFVRTDDGGYGVIVVPSMATNTLIYKSVGSTPTLTGYVRDVWAKNYET